jgi:hypothetical protein
MLLKIVAHARDVGRYLNAVGQPYPRNLAQRRIGLFGGGGIHPNTNPSFLRRTLQSRRFYLLFRFAASFSYELVNCRHNLSPFLEKNVSITVDWLSVIVKTLNEYSYSPEYILSRFFNENRKKSTLPDRPSSRLGRA